MPLVESVGIFPFHSDNIQYTLRSPTNSTQTFDAMAKDKSDKQVEHVPEEAKNATNQKGQTVEDVEKATKTGDKTSRTSAKDQNRDEVAQEQLKLLKKQAYSMQPLAAPSSPPPVLSENSVILCRNNNWDDYLPLSMWDYIQGERQILNMTMYKQATWAAFNLPAGTVMTLMENPTPVPAGKNVADLSNCGRCIDLVGTGATVAVDLNMANIGCCISMFFWRTVDFDLGAIELFENPQYLNNRNIIFLGEWNPGTIYSIRDWWIAGQVSSVRWTTLDRATAALFQNVDGSGNQYNNIKGWGNELEVPDLYPFGFNDMTSAFQWNAVPPTYEVIHPFKVQATAPANGSGLTSVVNGTNNSSRPQPITITLENSDAQSVTAATEDQMVMGVSISVSTELTGGNPEVASVSEKTEVGAHFDYTTDKTKSASDTKTITLDVSQTVDAPPYTDYAATLLVSIGNIPAKVYSTTADRWYNFAVANSKQDPTTAYPELWHRVEPVYLSMSGSLACNVSCNIDAHPITSSNGKPGAHTEHPTSSEPSKHKPPADVSEPMGTSSVVLSQAGTKPSDASKQDKENSKQNHDQSSNPISSKNRLSR